MQIPPVPAGGAPADWVTQAGPDHLRWLSEFALRLASAPHTVEAWADGRAGKALHNLLAHPELMRAARYITLIVAEKFEGESTSSIYPGWTWD